MRRQPAKGRCSTTGPPKGVEISHYNAIANCVQLVHKRSLVAATPAGLERKARQEASGERWLCALPMYHAYVRSLSLDTTYTHAQC